MMNQLPEKLMKLRRHYHISQQQVASFCHVELVEYMGWENGRSVPSEQQYMLLAELFHLSLEEMKSDSLDVTLQEVAEEVMEEVEVSEIKQPLLTEAEKTKSFKAIEEEKKDSELEESWLERLKDWRVWAIAAAILAVAFTLLTVFKAPENTLDGIEVNNRIIETERLASGKDFVLVLNSDGTVSARGNNDQGQLEVDAWSEIASIAAGDAFSAGLRKDGTVVAAGNNRYGQTETQEMTEIIEISAGAEHLAALKADGTVFCLGDNSEGQCEVADWTDVVTISAAKSSTLGLKKDGSVLFAGKMDVDTEEFASWSNIKKLINGQTQVFALTEDAKVYCTASSGYNICQFTESWTDVLSIKTKGNHAVVLHANGKLSASGDSSDGQGEIAQFKNIVSIAAGPDYVVTLNRDNELIGVGKNDFQQFENLQIIEKTKLQMVSEITVLIDSQVQILWGEVEGADYYAISIPEIGYSANVADLNASLSLDRFVNESVYTVGITALTMDHSKEQSNEAITMFTFFAPEVTIEPTPGILPTQTPDQGIIVPTPTPEATPEPTPEMTPEPTQIPEQTPETGEQPNETPDAEPTPQPTDDSEHDQDQITENEKSE